MIPNKTQLVALKKAAGCARFTYNWAKAEWEKQYEESKIGTVEKPTAYSLSRRWTKEKPEWAKESFSGLQVQAILNLGKAWINYWNKKTARPSFKKKGDRGSFYVPNAKAHIKEDRVHLPLIGKVKLREPLRFQGKIVSYTVSCEAGEWHVSVAVQVSELPISSNPSVVGVDVGIKNIAVASDGSKIINPKRLAEKQKRIARYQRKLARQVKGSNRRNATKLRIAKINKRIVNQRVDSIHKFTTALAKNHGTAVIEALDITGMIETVPAKCVRRSFQDTAMREVHRQLEYKMRVERAPKYFPSSKRCSACGDVKESLPPNIRVYKCACGAVLDRDDNASYNLRDMPWVTGSKDAEPSKRATKRQAKKATSR